MLEFSFRNILCRRGSICDGTLGKLGRLAAVVRLERGRTQDALGPKVRQLVGKIQRFGAAKGRRLGIVQLIGQFAGLLFHGVHPPQIV